MHITNTKKMGCPATILVRSVELFSEYEVDLNSSQDVKREVRENITYAQLYFSITLANKLRDKEKKRFFLYYQVFAGAI